MPTATAYRRAPLVNPAYVPLSDSAVSVGGILKTLTERVLKMVDLNSMSALDAVLATKLGGYQQTPPMPNVEYAARQALESPVFFAETMRAAALVALMNRSKDEMMEVLRFFKEFAVELPQMSEEKLFSAGADLLRLTVDLYRRTGRHFLLEILESLRARLPDVAGVMHMFPFQTDYRPENRPYGAREQEYYDRMQRLATGKWTADCMAMTTMLSQYSGSGRDAAAAQVGMAALMRYHGMPTGAFSADPYLAGRNPSRAVELPAACAQVEAYLDMLCATGDVAAAEKIEMLLTNVLADLVDAAGGVRTLSPINRLAEDDSCVVVNPAKEDVTALLRALYAARRAAWLSRDDATVVYMLPLSGGCVTRLNGVPVRLTARCEGLFKRTITIRVECRQSVEGTVLLRVPGYAEAARVSVDGQTAEAEVGQMHAVRRVFQTGDLITLELDVKPRLEMGWHGSASIYVGAQLMALALPDEQASWNYAVMGSMPLTQGEDRGEPYALITACEAMEWMEKKGFIAPPPRDPVTGAAYELMLIPFAGTDGRIAAFPCVQQR